MVPASQEEAATSPHFWAQDITCRRWENRNARNRQRPQREYHESGQTMGPAGQREHHDRVRRYHADKEQLADDGHRDSRRNYRYEPDNRYETVRHRDNGSYQKANNGRNTICYDSDSGDIDHRPPVTTTGGTPTGDTTGVKAVKETMMTPGMTTERSESTYYDKYYTNIVYMVAVCVYLYPTV